MEELALVAPQACEHQTAYVWASKAQIAGLELWGGKQMKATARAKKHVCWIGMGYACARTRGFRAYLEFSSRSTDVGNSLEAILEKARAGSNGQRCLPTTVLD